MEGIDEKSEVTADRGPDEEVAADIRRSANVQAADAIVSTGDAGGLGGRGSL